MIKSTISVGCDAMTGRNPARSHATPASELLALRARESTYPGAAEHISTVRADLRPLLRDGPVADDVILCASELAANAATHSNSRLPGGTFTVRIIVSRGDFIRIEIHDNGGPWTPAITDTHRTPRPRYRPRAG
jgi:anti-sigma regulatory factor (Ser/Thr protein kinase)